MDILIMVSGLIFSLCLIISIGEDSRWFKMAAIGSLIICALLVVYVSTVNRVIIDTYINTDMIEIDQQNIRFNRPIKIKITRYHIPYCSGMLDKTEYLIGE